MPKRRIDRLLDTAWADFGLDNPKAVARAVVLLRDYLATLPEDGNLHGPTEDLLAALEDDPATARPAWTEWIAAEATKARRKFSDQQATRKASKAKPTVEKVRKEMYELIAGKPDGRPLKSKVSGRLGVSESTLDRLLRDAGTSWIKIKTSYPGKV